MKHAVRAILALLCVAAAARGALADTPPNAFAGLTYRAIGPAISGGRTTAVVGSDVDPNVYYAGGADGGVFKSVDGGVAWNPVFDSASSAAIGAIAVAPHDPADVWVGTGEANPRNDVAEGDGVWHSRDGGKTWQHAGLADAGTISSIAIDPRDPRTVVAGVLGHVFRDGTMRGIYLTRDGGATWRRTLYLGPSSGASSIARDPERPSRLFAGVWQFRRLPWDFISGGPAGGLFRSDDGGATWQRMQGNGLPSGLTGRIGITAGTRGRVYAIVQSREGDVWRSDDHGTTWREMPHSPYVGARPFYFSTLTVDPHDRDRVLNVSLILSMSTDGARTWHKIATTAGWDYHANWWSADGKRIIDGNDEGVVLSTDGAAHWRQPYDLPFAQAYHVSYAGPAPSYRVCFGLQDNNAWCGPSTADNGAGVLNRDWSIVGPGDGMHAAYDPTDPNLVWSTTTNDDTGQVYLFDARTTQTEDRSPYARNTEVAQYDLPYRFNWDTPLAFGASGTVYAGGNVLFASDDRGLRWKAISPDLTRNDKSKQGVPGCPITQDASGAENFDTILSVAASRTTAGVIWVGTDDGLVQLTRDGGSTWSNVTPPALPAWSRVANLELGRASPLVAYVAVDAHTLGDDRPYAFATSDGGAHWRSIAGDLPRGAFLRVVREDPQDANVLYGGTDRGVYVTLDGGAHWHALRLNMPASAVYDLQVHPERHDLIVATHGRGIWILDDVEPALLAAAGSSEPLIAIAPQDAYRMWQAAPLNTFTDGSLPDGEFNGDNRAQGAIFTYYLARAVPQVDIDVVARDGTVVKHLRGAKMAHLAGIVRASWDLAEDGPVQWAGTFEQNRGPKSGAEALPGTYTVRIRAGANARDVPLTIRADPRDPRPLVDLEGTARGTRGAVS